MWGLHRELSISRPKSTYFPEKEVKLRDMLANQQQEMSITPRGLDWTIKQI